MVSELELSPSGQEEEEDFSSEHAFDTGVAF